MTEADVFGASRGLLFQFTAPNGTREGAGALIMFWHIYGFLMSKVQPR
jgi:hypothetical protein